MEVMAHAGDRLLRGTESARQRLADALAVPRGSYPFSRDYGATVVDLIDRPLDGRAEAAVFAAVAATLTHPPNGLADLALRAVRLETDTDEDQPGRVHVLIEADWTGGAGVTPIGLRQQLAVGRDPAPDDA